MSIGKSVYAQETRCGFSRQCDTVLCQSSERTKSKSRITFPALLRAEHQDYVRLLPQAQVALLETHGGCFADKGAWELHRVVLAIKGNRHVAIATQEALMGSVLAYGVSADRTIVSDDAGQFNVFHHARGFTHAERSINRLIPLNDNHRKAQAWIRKRVWSLYACLKIYQEVPGSYLLDE